MAEPIYVDDGDGTQEVLTFEYCGLLYPELAKHTFHAVRRIHLQFKNRTELSQWRKVEQLLKKGMISGAWVLNCIQLARTANRAKFKVERTFRTITAYMRNIAAYQEWASLNRQQESTDIETQKFPTEIKPKWEA